MALIVIMFFVLGFAFGMEAYKRWSRKNRFKILMKIEITDKQVTNFGHRDFVIIDSEGNRHAIVDTDEIHPGEYIIATSYHPF